MPAGAATPPFQNIRMTRCSSIFVTILTVTAATSNVCAQVPIGSPARRATSVSGIVTDSLAHTPLADAVIQLVRADSLAARPLTATSDSLGHYRIASVPAGRYLIGFLHPMLDSLGLEPRLREVFVDDGIPLRADLAIPSAVALRIAFCGAASASASDAAVIGFVRRANDLSAVDSAHVLARWLELTIGSGGLTRTTVRREFLTLDTGWFVLCHLPNAATVTLIASHGTDSTEALDVEVPANGFLRRALYFGAARAAVSTGAPAAADSNAQPGVRVLTGDGVLSGRVVTADGGNPLSGARVGIRSGPQTRSDERGQWKLTGVPTGTRTLEVRAVAHYPVVQPVDVVQDAAPIRIAMATLKSVLDTVRVSAVRGGNRVLADFLQRKKSSGTGKFITSEDIAARNPVYTSDVFRTVLGVYIDHDQNGEDVITMRGNATGHCQPGVYINGMSMRNVSSSDLNGLVRPNDVIGIEVYTAAGAPPQFSQQNGCGSIVFWTR